MEAALASRYHGADGDLRSLHRRGAGMSLRRLSVLIRHLPYDSPLWPVLEAAEKKREAEAGHAFSAEKDRARRAYWQARKEGVASD